MPYSSDMHGLLTALGRRVRDLRRQRGESLERLAEQAGLSRRFLVEIEAGRANPSLLKLASLARALRLELPALLALPLARPARRLALVGLRGAGKSTVGRALAQILEIPFTELDVWIQEHAGMSNAQIFELEGAAGFRRREEEALEAWLSRTAEGVLAVAGGLADNPAAWERLLGTCTVLWLRASPQEHWNRVVAQGDARPMRGLPDARARLEALWRERESAYARAHFMLDTTGRDAAHTQEAILALLAASDPASPALSAAPARP